MARGAIYALLALIPAAAIGIGYMACSGGDEAVNEAAILEAESAAVAGAGDPHVVGTWRAGDVKAGGTTLMVFKTDGTFARGMAVVCATTPCPDVLAQGKYQTFTLDKHTFVTLQENDMIIDRYEYRVIGETMRLLRIGKGGVWESVTKTMDKPWCAVPNDCSVQNLPVGPCAGQWLCGANVCNYQCGRPPCDSAMGGECPPSGPSPEAK